MFPEALSQRLGKPVQEITIGEERLALILLGDSRGAVLCTSDVSKLTLPVPETYHAEAVIELYFLLPEYWQFDLENPLFNWAANRLIAIKNYLAKGHWAISGHTFGLGELPEGRFKEQGFSALLLMNPIALPELSSTIEVAGREVQCKALCPIFKMEKDVKEARGNIKFLHRLMDKGITERLDEFRASVVKPRFLFWR
ncbi:MAG: suppressor of fused domain protein [Crocinitomicaceae bacterium]|nr:suppressor of fused domain protein [Crocinitomicaceae bacterium]